MNQRLRNLNYQASYTWSHTNDYGTCADARAELQFAVCLGRSGDSVAAVSHFERLHEHSPADLATNYDLASVYVERRRFRDAIHVLEQARTAGTHLDPDTMNLLANAYAGNDQVRKAIETYRKTITLDPHDERQYIDLAILSMDHQSPEVALGVLMPEFSTIPSPVRSIRCVDLYILKSRRTTRLKQTSRLPTAFLLRRHLAPLVWD